MPIKRLPKQVSTRILDIIPVYYILQLIAPLLCIFFALFIAPFFPFFGMIGTLVFFLFDLKNFELDYQNLIKEFAPLPSPTPQVATEGNTLSYSMVQGQAPPSRFQWFQYKWTLRLEWLIALFTRSFSQWNASKPDFSETELRKIVGELSLETSLVMGYRESFMEDGKLVLKFQFTDFKLPTYNEIEEIQHFDNLEVIVDPVSRVGIRCSLDGEDMEWKDAVAVLYLCCSVNMHAVCHSYSNWGCDVQSVSSILRWGALFTIAMNYQAWLSGFLACREPEKLKEMLAYNVRKGMSCHRKLPEIAPYSRMVRFIMDSRPLLRKILAKHSVPINFEGFLQCSIIHSLDHFGISRAVDVPALTLSRRFRGAELRQYFTEPLLGLLVDTRLSRTGEKWAQELYQGLHAIDVDLADEISFCICY
eukprot:TRINITY_DN3520_c0_g1_i16.p1 TRINITY_DN3520_c0_g1~~TRINITY_DN3520_c0_g1_i16.p1  ORF type:complete len:419 (-),score=19.79 TRINITY_DN3520_c0_g1_i16:403-1659(-)